MENAQTIANEYDNIKSSGYPENSVYFTQGIIDCLTKMQAIEKEALDNLYVQYRICVVVVVAMVFIPIFLVPTKRL